MDVDALIWVPLVMVSAGAGFVGSLLGLGGGFIIVPALNLGFGMDLRSSVGIALIAVIATSCSSSITYLKQSYANLELACFLEVPSVLGAVLAVFVAHLIPPQLLYFGFAALLLVASFLMIKKNYIAAVAPTPELVTSRFSMTGNYFDEHGNQSSYHTQRPWLGFGFSGIAGLLSGLLGIGGGVIKVPAMNLVMGVPLKVASATSNLMVGMTAATTASIMYVRGEIPLQEASFVALGVFLGSSAGARKLHGASGRSLSWLFLAIATFIATQMILKGFQI